jgi:hypothetical protein
VINYLTRLDEQRDHILSRTKVDVRRASSTVLIGHPEFVPKYTREGIDGTLRIYNSHVARVEVRHYAELIESAEAALRIAEEIEAVTEPEGEVAAPKVEADPWTATDPWGSPPSASDPWATPPPPPEWLADEPPF